MVPNQSRPSRPMKPAGLPKFASATPRSAPSTTGAIERMRPSAAASSSPLPTTARPRLVSIQMRPRPSSSMREIELSGSPCSTVRRATRAVAQAAQASSVAGDPDGAVRLREDVANQPSRHAFGRAELRGAARVHAEHLRVAAHPESAIRTERRRHERRRQWQLSQDPAIGGDQLDGSGTGHHPDRPVTAGNDRPDLLRQVDRDPADGPAGGPNLEEPRVGTHPDDALARAEGYGADLLAHIPGDGRVLQGHLRDDTGSGHVRQAPALAGDEGAITPVRHQGQRSREPRL